MNCIKGAVDGGSQWSFTPKSNDSNDTSKSSSNSGLAARSTIPKTSPLSSVVETAPVADDEARIFALSPEPEFPEHLEGSSPTTPSQSPAELSSVLSEKDLPLARRSFRKRSMETFPDTEPSGSGHQTQDAVLKDLLTSTSIIQRAARARL